MNNWRQLKAEHTTIFKVNSIDLSAIFILYDNCYRMGNESNSNVTMATVTPEVWFDDLVTIILSNVSFVTKLPNYETISLDNMILVSTVHSCESLNFESIESLKDFIIEKGSLSILTLYSIVQYINLRTLKPSWMIRFNQIIDPQAVRDKKIDYLTGES